VTEESAYIKTRRDQRYITCRCSGCGREFYIEATVQNIEKIIPSDQSIIEDEDELMAAEEEIKRQTDEENDHRVKGNI
jgi:formate dehydrogenase assembly factor FdhD